MISRYCNCILYISMLQRSFSICVVIFCVVFIIIYFVPSLSSVFLHAVFYAICKVSLFHILILQLLLLFPVKPANIRILLLLLLCPVKPANIRHFEWRTPPCRVIFQDTSIWWKTVKQRTLLFGLQVLAVGFTVLLDFAKIYFST